MGERIVSVTTIGVSDNKVVQPQPQRLESRYLFMEELAKLSYSFGDERDPRSDTVELLECYMIEYIKDLLTKAQNRSSRRGQPKLEIPDLMHYLKDQPKQFHRIKGLQKAKKNNQKTTGLLNSIINDEDIVKKKRKD
jgi:hypothetical protein